MADLSNSGGGSAISFFSGTVVLASGASGDLITLTPPAGKRVIIKTLFPADYVESDITIQGSISGEIVSGKTLNANAAQAAGTFFIGQSTYSGTTEINNAGGIIELAGEVDEVITVKKNTGATGAAIHYSYAYGG
jgi:hypothetical protein